MKHIKNSPIDHSALEGYITCKDHTVSQKEFTIVRDVHNELLITSPRPVEADLGKYYESTTYISHTDAKKSLLDRMYQWVRNFTLKGKLKLITSLKPQDKTILDLGCGTGDFLTTCQNSGWKISGVEPNEKAREAAKKKLQKQIYTNIVEVSTQQFDIITMWHVLEHVPNLEETITQLNQLLKPGGTLIIAVPNYKSYDAQYYKNHWAAYDVPRHLWHFSQTAIRRLFMKYHMKVEKVLPMKFDAFYVSLLSEKYKTGAMNPIKAFLIGMLSNLKAVRSKEYSSLIYLIKNT